MSRQKENNPLHSRAVGSVFIGKQPPPPSTEFFTDSLLEDTSRIPSPSPLKSKNAISNPRRAQRTSKSSHVSKGSGNTARHAPSLQTASSRGIRHQQPAPTLQRPLSMRSSNSDLITPPQSRDGPESIKSPMSVDSVPSHDLMDTYQRIYDEEELAATEREPMSSDDDEELDYEDQAESPSRAARHSSKRNSRVDLQSMKLAAPEELPEDADKENVADENTCALSQASGMSFLAELTDKDLAQKMTPHVSERAQDKRRLQSGISTRPISFHAGTRPSEFLADDARSNASSDRSSRASRRRRLQTGSPVINGVSKAHSDTSVEIRSRASPAAERKPSSQASRLRSPMGAQEPLGMPSLSEQQQTEDARLDHFSDDEDDETSPELRARERQFDLKRARKLFGLSSSKAVAGAISEANAAGTFSAPQRSQAPTFEDVEDVEMDAGSEDFTQSSIRSHGSQPTESSVLRAPVQNKVPATNKGILQKWAKAAAEQRTDRQNRASDADSSQIDWLGAAVDIPLPSVEANERDLGEDEQASLRQRPSTDRLRRIENETTGLSFQVSESPPVKSKKSFDDIIREKEIDQLSRQAVTKSRLEAIRERDPREAHRRLSRSPSGSSLRQSISNDAARPKTAELDPVGEQIPDTPVVVYRTSSRGSRSPASELDRPQHDRRSSHDALQRFARLSATPKSSPSITPKFEPSQRQTEADAAQDREGREQMRPKMAPIAATPRVTGAWTDTILPPDTIATVKPKPQPRYIQTPHVRPGGWVDTPLPPPGERPATAPEPVDEVTADLTTDVVPKPPDAAAHVQSVSDSAQPPSTSLAVGQSALSNILAVQRARIASAPAAAGAGIDDTLNLGEATMASLEDLVDLNEEDVTTLIRLGAEHDALQQLSGHLNLGEGDQKEAEIVVLDRLTKKLNTLQANIRHARRAVGRFEREMSEGIAEDPPAPHMTPQTTGAPQPQPSPPTVPARAQIRGTGVFPILYSTLTLPLPLLFRPEPPSSSSTTSRKTTPAKPRRGIAKYLPRFPLPGRPTPLLWALFACFAYYFIEVLLSELYSHPLYAESYSWPTPTPMAGARGLVHGQAGQVKGEPEFGVVLPTLLARGVFGGDVGGGLWKGFRGWADVVGGWVFDDLENLATTAGGGSGGGGVGDAAQAGASGWETGQGEGWSIMNDEVL